MARKKFSKEEKKQMRKEQRQKDALHSYRCRGFKNFLFWLTGVLSSVVLIISALFIGVAVVPVRVYLGDNADGIVSYDVSSKSLINAFLKANTYDMSDFPVVADALDDLIKGANLDEYVEIDVEKIKTLKFDETFSTELQSCIKVVATMDSVGGMDAIGDIGNLEILNEWEEVQIENLPTTDVDGNIAKDEESGELTSNPKLYYYYHVETEGASSMATRFAEGKGEWRRAFDDNGNRVPESVGQQLYYANISQVPILDIVDLIDETIGRLKLTDLLEGLGGAKLEDISLIGNILGDKTISQIGDITAENISLTAILPYEESKDIYKILLQVCGAEIDDWNDEEEVKAAAECLNITSFNGGLHFENVALATFLPYEDTENGVDNSELYRILLKICGAEIKDWNDAEEVKAAAEKLNINSFGDLNLENFSLTTFLPYEENATTYEMLLKITGAQINDWNDAEEVKAAAEKLNINSFSNLNLENFSLATFLPYEKNAEIYAMLLKITGAEIKDWNDAEEVKAAAEKLNINSFSNLNLENLSLTTFLPYEENATTYEMLLKITGAQINDWNDVDEVKSAAEKLNINSFNSLNLENLSLTTFLPYEENATTYEMLLKITGAQINDWNDVAEVKAAAEKLNINSFNSLNLENLSLTTFLPYEENVATYEMLLKITGAQINDWNDAEEVKAAAEKLNISSFSSLNFESLSLTTFLPYEENADTYKTLLQILGVEIEDWNDEDKVKAEAEKLNVNSFTSLNFEKVSVGMFIDDADTLKILLDAVNGGIKKYNQNLKPGETAKELLEDTSDLTVGHLTMISLESMNLASLLPYEGNEQLYKMLLQASNADVQDWDDAEEVKQVAEGLDVNSLGALDFNKVSIAMFIEEDATLNLILDAVNGEIRDYNSKLKPGQTPKQEIASASKLTIEHLSSLNVVYVKLDTVLPVDAKDEHNNLVNQTLYSILSEMLNKDAKSITVNDLSNIKFENITLNAVLPVDAEDGNGNLINKALYDVLVDALGGTKTADSIMISDLSNFKFDKIRLSTVMPKTAENSALYSVLLDVLNGNKLPTDKDYVSEDKITISHLSTFNFDNVKLNSILPVDAVDKDGNKVNEGLYEILLDVINGETGTKTAEQIAVSDLTGFNINNVKLSTVMPMTDDNQALYKVLLDVINGNKLSTDANYVDEGDITISHLSSFKFDGVKLNSVLPIDAIDKDGNKINQNLYNILVDALGGTKTAQNIMISDLSSFNYSNIKLSTVMPKTSQNQALYRVLLDVINGDKLSTDANYVAEDKITLNHLSAFNFDGVKLNTVLPVDAVDKDGNKVNEGLYKILLDVVNAGKSELNKKTAQEITIADLSNFEMNNINLSTVLPYEENGQPINTALYSILLDVVNGDSGVKTAKDLKLSDLTGFSYDNLHLITILDPVKNASLYNVLCDVVKVDKEELKISHLSAFEVSKIHLKTVLGDKATGNVILDKLIEKDVEISSLATAINGLSLYEIYGQNCFVKVENGETGVARYKKKGNSYILDDDGEYKISNSAGIWLFLCFDFVDEAIDKINLSTMGCRVKYTIGEATFNSLTEQGSGNNLSKQLTTATIRQLVDAGVLESANPMLYTFTLQDAVKVR